MNDKTMSISIPEGSQHVLQFGAMIIAVSIAWGVLSTKVGALENDEKTRDKKIEVLTSDMNKQAVTIGQIVVTTKNIEKQMSQQQRLLEKISAQLMSPRPATPQ